MEVSTNRWWQLQTVPHELWCTRKIEARKQCKLLTSKACKKIRVSRPLRPYTHASNMKPFSGEPCYTLGGSIFFWPNMWCPKLKKVSGWVNQRFNIWRTTICNRCNNSKKHTSWFRHWKRGRNFWTIKTRKLYKAELDGNSLFDATRRPRKLSWIPKIAIVERRYHCTIIIFGIDVGFRGCHLGSWVLKQDAGHGVFIEFDNVFLAIIQNYKKQYFYKSSSRKNLGKVQNPFD